MEDNPELEEAFEKIKQGNESEEMGNAWDAAHCFREATALLADLRQSGSDADDDEQRKIVELYEAQRALYFGRAQNNFVEAVKEDHSHCVDRNPPIVSDDEAEARVLTFSSLFSKPIKKEQNSEEKPILEQQSSLEERLASLNSSLPQGFKTSKQRMADINMGLSRLGLTLYSNSNASSAEMEDKSEDEQVADIIAQAKDEVAFDVQKRTNASSSISISDEDSGSSDSESSLDIEDLGIDTPFPRRKILKRKVVKVQARLAELIAWLDSVGDREVDLETKDALEESVDEEIDFDLAEGKALLRKARNGLRKASEDWP